MDDEASTQRAVILERAPQSPTCVIWKSYYFEVIAAQETEDVGSLVHPTRGNFDLETLLYPEWVGLGNTFYFWYLEMELTQPNRWVEKGIKSQLSS